MWRKEPREGEDQEDSQGEHPTTGSEGHREARKALEDGVHVEMVAVEKGTSILTVIRPALQCSVGLNSHGRDQEADPASGP